MPVAVRVSGALEIEGRARSSGGITSEGSMVIEIIVVFENLSVSWELVAEQTRLLMEIIKQNGEIIKENQEIVRDNREIKVYFDRKEC